MKSRCAIINSDAWSQRGAARLPLASEQNPRTQKPIWAIGQEGCDRVDAIIAAIEPPVTRLAVAALAEKAQTAADFGPIEDRPAWREIAAELARRVARYEA